MLLMCCFRDSSSPGGRRKGGGLKKKRNEDPPYEGNRGLLLRAETKKERPSFYSSPSSSSSSSSSSDFGFKGSSRLMDKHPGAKKLLKPRSNESLGPPRFLQSASPPPPPPPPLIPASSASQTNTPSHQKGLRTEASAHSVPNLSHGSPVKKTSLSFASQYKSPPPPPSVVMARGSNNQLEKVEERIQGRGMCRSNASYGIQSMLQSQIANDTIKREAEIAKREMELKNSLNNLTLSYEEKIKNLQNQHNLQIQQLKNEKQTSLINAKNVQETELKSLTSAYETRISEMKRAHQAEIQKLRTEYEKKLETQKAEFDKSSEEFKEKDEAWQLEKQDVLSEIQRLKEEANRFIAILSQDDYANEEKMSPQKKQTLHKEIQSLQLVIDMRTGEIHKLRQERIRHLQQLEEFEKTRNLLSKMQAKVEDLQAQLENKSILERQLSLEKSKLESSFEEETKKKARMSMQSDSVENVEEDVEELQWRIRNNFELPTTKILSPSSEKDGGFCVYNDNDTNNNNNRSNNNHGEAMDNNNLSSTPKRSSPIKKIHTDDNASPYSFQSETRTSNSPSKPSPVRPSTIRLDSTGSSLAPSPRGEDDDDGVDELNDEDEILVLEREGEEDDEGLGDISSEASSPQPGGNAKENPNADNNVSSSSSKTDERMPSRIPLSLETNL